MICEACGSSKESRVLESRERENFVARKRKCSVCGYEYLTHEKFVRGCKSVRGPRILYLNELKNYNEAVWLELRTGKITATAISGMTEDTVYFDNGTRQDKKACLHMWRVWDRHPNIVRRKEEKWN